MAIRFTINGIDFEADTAAEAVEMAAAFAGKREAPRRPDRARPQHRDGSGSATNGHVATDSLSPIVRFLQSLNKNGKRLVEYLAGQAQGATTDELAEAIQISTLALPPIIRHVHVMAARAGFNPEEVLTRKQVSVDNRPKSLYEVDQIVKRHLDEAGDR